MTAPPSVKGREAPVHTEEISKNQGTFLLYVLLSAFSYTENLIGVLPSSCFCDMVIIFWSVSWGSQTRTRAGTGCVYPPSENPLSDCQLCVPHTQPDSNPGVKPRRVLQPACGPKTSLEQKTRQCAIWGTPECFSLPACATTVLSPTSLARGTELLKPWSAVKPPVAHSSR